MKPNNHMVVKCKKCNSIVEKHRLKDVWVCHKCKRLQDVSETYDK